MYIGICFLKLNRVFDKKKMQGEVRFNQKERNQEFGCLSKVINFEGKCLPKENNCLKKHMQYFRLCSVD